MKPTQKHVAEGNRLVLKAWQVFERDGKFEDARILISAALADAEREGAERATDALHFVRDDPAYRALRNTTRMFVEDALSTHPENG